MIALLLAAAATQFDPVDFFRGRTRGEGTLKIVFQKARPIRVDSVGTAARDGALILTQTIREGDKPPRVRTWRMRKEPSGGYSGTRTDAVGPVRLTAENGAIRIRYRDKDNLDFDQRLVATSPRELRNRMTVKRFGVTVARIDETIRKLD